MTTPLTDVLTPATRKLVYQLYVVVGFVVGGVQVAFATIPNQDTPVALTVAINVLAYAGIGLGLTAASNITPPGSAAVVNVNVPAANAAVAAQIVADVAEPQVP